MSLYIIKNDSKDLTPGENKLLSKIKKLYESYESEAYLYVQPTISSLIPDFILIDKKKGISILEVKDWSLSYIKDVNKRRAILSDREDDNPVNKTKQYFNICNGIISDNDKIYDLNDFLYANTVLTNMSGEDLQGDKIKSAFNIEPVKILSKDILSKLTITDMFSNVECEINEDETIDIRTSLFPEIKIVKENNEEEESLDDVSIYSLDEKQENYSRKFPYGPYMITGVPGSGKTQILIARAIHLIKENPRWKIQIVTYNLSLANKIESILNEIAKDYSNSFILKDIEIQNIGVSTFHKLAMRESRERMPCKLSAKEKHTWFDETLPNLALEKCKPTYDAILIDEYQDFQDDWIKVCVKLCKKYKYKNYSGKEVEGVNIFMAGDRLQSIYNSKEHSWSKLGINMQGRSNFLKTCYRAGRENSFLALKFLQQNEYLREEVKRFYKENEDIILDNTNEIKSTIDFIEGEYEEIINCVNSLIRSKTYSYNDILIICNYKNQCEKIKNMLPSNIRINTRFIKEADKEDMDTCLLTSTYYSSKGLEGKIVILVDVDFFSGNLDNKKEIMDRKLLYVGMTRASEKLIIHGKNFYKNSFAKDIKNIYESSVEFG
ncbi:hypothetical protein QX51_06925 [Terrisporobacter othiniensis]|uniref:Uncharacterized protein n=1 Tax=Terrisporobacter othiniensis TaxID=1577792 RepID=A0A0B3VY34_9FIRM|nr:hypothetical protein QX51_06925 [Terrisporobacter othiniensis]